MIGAFAPDRGGRSLDLKAEDLDTSTLQRVVIGAILGCLLLYFGALAVRKLLRDRALRRSPALVEGEQLSVSGVVRATGPTIVAPLSSYRCVAYRARARVFGGADHADIIAEPIETAATPFTIETPRGAIAIDAAELVFDAPPTSIPDDATTGQREFRVRNKLDAKTSLQFDELALAPGSHVTIRGVVAIDQDPSDPRERGHRDNAAARIRLVATQSAPLTILRIW